MEGKMNRERIGQVLTGLRKSRNETLSEVAEAVGASQSAISMYESGDRIPRDEIKLRLAQHYDVPVESIFFANEQHETCDSPVIGTFLPRAIPDPLG